MSVIDAVTNLDRVQRYPKQPCVNDACYVNTNYNTLPANYPREVVNSGPAQVLHIYPGRKSECGNTYPNIKEYRPIDTMYGYDKGTYDCSGTSGNGRRVSYGYQAYPFSDRYVREINHYAPGKPLPTPDIKRWQLETLAHKPPLRQGVWNR